MKIKLYHYPATRSARVLWMLHELTPDIDMETETIDLYDGEQYQSDFRSLFPFHAVPAIEISSNSQPIIRMTESGAILVALGDAFPQKNLAPAPLPISQARADYLHVIHACGAVFDMILWQIRIHEHVLNASERDDRTIARYRRKYIQEVDPFLAGRLSSAPYICGERFTAADCMAGHIVMWAQRYGLSSGDTTQAYLSRLAERPAFQAAFVDAVEFEPMLPQDAPARALFTG
jgi:glutathione S-transferase